MAKVRKSFDLHLNEILKEICAMINYQFSKISNQYVVKFDSQFIYFLSIIKCVKRRYCWEWIVLASILSESPNVSTYLNAVHTLDKRNFF